jgi:trigger factor
MSENDTNEDVAVDDSVAVDGEFEFAEDPTFDVDYKGDCAYEVKVAVPASNTLKQSEEMYEELQGDAELPGFRRGKAPRKLLERKFGKAVRGEATEKIVSAAFRKLIKAESLSPIDYPDIDGLEDVHDTPLDAPLEFTLKFEVAPRVKLGNYKGLKVERPVLEIKDEQIDEAIESMRERFASHETVEDAKAQEEDQVIIDFSGVIDGEEFAGGSAENYPYILGSGRFFAEFETALKGAKTGQEVTCDVPFPEDYSSVDVAGKTATFTIKVNEIKRKTLPELDDDFATGGGFDSLADLREKVAKDLQDGASNQGQQIAEKRAVDAIVETSTFELPKSLVESSAKEYYNQEVRRLLALRTPQEEMDKRDEELRKNADEHAEHEIKGYFAVSEIASTEGVVVEEADFEKEAHEITLRTGMELEVAQRFLDQEDKRSDYENRIYRQKAMAIVMDAAKVKDKVVTREEMEKEEESADA